MQKWLDQDTYRISRYTSRFVNQGNLPRSSQNCHVVYASPHFELDYHAKVVAWPVRAHTLSFRIMPESDRLACASPHFEIQDHARK